MAILYLDSNAVGGSGSGVDWANAHLTINALLLAATSPSDIGWMADDHAESTAASIAIYRKWGSNPYNIIPIYRVDKITGLYSPTTKDGLGVVNFTTVGIVSGMSVGFVSFHGVKLRSDEGLANISNSDLFLTDCYVEVSALSAGNGVNLSTARVVEFLNSGFKYIGTGAHELQIVNTGRVSMIGCKFVTGLGSHTHFFTINANDHATLHVEDCDFSGVTGTPQLLDSSGATSQSRGGQQYKFINNKLAPGQTISGTAPVERNIFHLNYDGCSDGSTREDLNKDDIGGFVAFDKNVYRTGGYTDRDTGNPMSVALETTANTSINQPCATHDILIPYESLAAFPRVVTITVEILRRNATPLSTIANTWLEVEYENDGSHQFYSLSYGARDMTQLSGVVPPASAASWINIPAGFVTGKLEATVTLSRKSVVTVRVCTAAYDDATDGNPMLYVCPVVGVV